MEKVYVFGHKKPDTDTVCGAIALSYLKIKMGINAEPRVLGEISAESKFALDKFGIETPKYLNDVKVQLKDIKYKKNFFINQNESIYETYSYMSKKGITGIPIVDDNKKFIGYVSLKEIAKELIISASNTINTSFDNLAKTLNASKTYKYDDHIQGEAVAITMPYKVFVDKFEVNESSVVIGCNREQVLRHALESKAKLVILLDVYNLAKEEITLAKKNKVNIIVTPYNTFKVSRIICLANPIKTIQRGSSAVCFEPSDYMSDFLEVSNKLKHTNYPIVNSKGICEGLLRVIDTSDLTRKKVILVDHNEPAQSVDGLGESTILEIVDHHNIGNIYTNAPINFRNMSVGSVNTIIYYLFMEQSIKIPKEIAGIMLSGILSDTLMFASPTTTDLDKSVAKILAKTAKVDLVKYGLELLKSGVSIEGMSVEDVIYKDFKNYTAGDHKIGIAQVFTTTFTDYEKNLPDYINELNEISENSGYKVVCLFVTDIINNNSYILYNEKAKTYLEDAYGLKDITEGYLLKGVVSRKKQMVPLILDVIEKI